MKKYPNAAALPRAGYRGLPDRLDSGLGLRQWHRQLQLSAGLNEQR
jgi:hypothetical protein